MWCRKASSFYVATRNWLFFETAPDGARNYREIYEYSDDRKIISEFVSIKYTNDHKDIKNMELEDAIKNEVKP